MCLCRLTNEKDDGGPGTEKFSFFLDLKSAEQYDCFIFLAFKFLDSGVLVPVGVCSHSCLEICEISNFSKELKLSEKILSFEISSPLVWENSMRVQTRVELSVSSNLEVVFFPGFTVYILEN